MKYETADFQKKMNASAERIWKVITRQEEMKNWYFDLEEFKAEQGFTFTFRAGDNTISSC